MRHLPIEPDVSLGANRRVTTGSFPDDFGEKFLDALKSYLECRCRGAEPPPHLVEAWNRFYDSYAPRVRAFLRRSGLPRADRSDCSQEVWKEVVAHLGHFQHDPRRGHLSTWLMTLARNKAVDSIRRRHQLLVGLDEDAVELVGPDPDPAAECDRRTSQVEVRTVLAALSRQVSATSFQVLYLRWIDGRSIPEIAATLKLTPAQVRFRHHRMKHKFRELFERSLDQKTGESNAGQPRDAKRNGSARNKIRDCTSNQ